MNIFHIGVKCMYSDFLRFSGICTYVIPVCASVLIVVFGMFIHGKLYNVQSARRNMLVQCRAGFSQLADLF